MIYRRIKIIIQFKEFYYFRKHNQTNIDLKSTPTENYKRINWTDEIIAELNRSYLLSTNQADCTGYDGKQIPGDGWENVAPIKQVPRTIFGNENCPNFNPFGVIPLHQGRCGYAGECIY